MMEPADRAVVAQEGDGARDIAVHTEIDGISRQMVRVMRSADRGVVASPPAGGVDGDRAVGCRDLVHDPDQRAVEATTGGSPGQMTPARQAFARRARLVILIAPARDPHVALFVAPWRILVTGILVRNARFFGVRFGGGPVTLGLASSSSQKFPAACALETDAGTKKAAAD